MEAEMGDLLQHTKPLHHQVGGHAGKTAFLECGDGTILKPLQSRGRGEREVDFYRLVYDPTCTDSVLLQLRPLLPSFLGAFTSPDEPNVTYMKLEDIAAGFKRPCVADIKMGARTYDPLADPAKIAREEAKYPPAKKIGFQLRGMRIYDGRDDSFQKHGKEFLRKFTEDTVSDGLSMFFTNGCDLRKDILAACLLKLQPILNWFKNQKSLSFYSSSILIIYEGFSVMENRAASDCLSQNSDNQGLTQKTSSTSNLPQPNQGIPTPYENQDDNLISNTHEIDMSHRNTRVDVERVPEELRTIKMDSCPPNDLVRVCMIDFTHVFPLNGETPDENYLFGLENLVRLLEGLLKK